ncbi:Flp family type IVb pilin [Geomonas ferrireducens]|jgi:pilus assembly protein Flp/PilA|uniref:Flp family type IVb pilin n=1 Tax=Geomonas ferrireducens TaxID=2570227 RepID=UPI0010A8DDF6|nr:Flp family type IVb pilin [Geomonas ferrireducens]
MTEWIKALYVRLLAGFAALKSQKGQGLVEYALILVLIAVVVIAIMTSLGNKTSQVFSKVDSSMTVK